VSILYQELVDQISAIAAHHQRQAPDLLAVSKNQPLSKILPLLEFGHRHFGENRVQEAMQKWPELKFLYPDLRLHLIGPLQTNKTKEALLLFDVIETIDRSKLAEKIAQHWDRAKDVKFLIQVNTGLEPQKSGVFVTDFPQLYRLCVEEFSLPIMGLMCIPPHKEDPNIHFQLLSQLARDYGLPWLSMGMSQDFPQAIAWGASWIRIGSALFGDR
jgi:PLP dependent protein